MVIMKGSTRILDKPLVEQSGSTNQLKLLSIYGITSYNQIIDIPFSVVCTNGAASYVNINVNSLGVKTLKYNNSRSYSI